MQYASTFIAKQKLYQKFMFFVALLLRIFLASYFNKTIRTMQTIKNGWVIICLLLLTSCKTANLHIVNSPITYSVNSSIEADTAIVNYYMPFKIQLENEMNRQIGYSDYFLNKDATVPEFLVGNFFADALLEMGKKLDSGIQFSLATKGGIRAALKQGPITIGSIFEIMPFENSVTLIELSGKDMQTLLSFIAKTGGQPVSGLSMQIKDNKPIHVEIAGQPFDSNRTYKMVTYDYLANGGDYMEGLSTPINRKNTGILVREGIIEYVESRTKEGKNINTQLDGRISHAK